MIAKVLCEEINFVPTEADPDVYIRQASKANRELYYKMHVSLEESSGRIDILTEVSVLSQGHFDAVYRIFNYIDKRQKAVPGKLGFDPARPDDVVSPLDGASADPIDWLEFYPDAAEELPRRMPAPHSTPVLTRAYVDANHAGNLANRRSHSGILIYINNSPVRCGDCRST